MLVTCPLQPIVSLEGLPVGSGNREDLSEKIVGSREEVRVPLYM